MAYPQAVAGAETFVSEFCAALQVDWQPPEDLYRAAGSAISACRIENALPTQQRHIALLALINSKFGLNDEPFQKFLDGAAAYRVFLNYHDKLELRQSLDEGDRERLNGLLLARHFPHRLVDLFEPTSPCETRAQFKEQLKNPKVTRSDARECDPKERRESMLRALFGGFVFRSFPPVQMHGYMNPDCKVRYYPDFYDHLLHFHPSVLHRHRALIFGVVDTPLRERLGDRLRDSLLTFLADAYDGLSNHCYLAILLKPFPEGEEAGQWRLFSDLILFAEKFRETPLKVGYFRPHQIESATREHIPHLPLNQGHFERANEGFQFRDCFVLPRSGTSEVETTDASCDILLLFERSERDETLVPCPACRSRDVRGNSYPSVGVKSWECQNVLCPASSAFDRGARYSVASLIKQRAIKSEVDQIPSDSLRRWKLDVVPNIGEQQVVDMLLRHFTLHGDTVLLANTASYGSELLGRHIDYVSLLAAKADDQRYERFQKSAFFSRFVLERPVDEHRDWDNIPTDIDGVQVYRGDSFKVLATLPASSVDGAVTSPPYYNARSYSIWPNIYCYLHDMYNIARQVHRVLRPGSYFLFNIFDYFDNENTVALSAMGKKRMILGAYCINLFRRVGFRVEGNVAWYKGEIEGKRNFNQGNRSPYYQFPFNCWEHVLVFRKPGDGEKLRFPTVIAAKPVIKMVRGENVLGHSAPFPPSIPDLLLRQMSGGQTVLDMFSGSMTTGRTARRYDIRSISIDLHQEYCDLGLKLL